MASSLSTVMAQAKKPITRQGLLNAVRINGYFEALKVNDLNKVRTYFTADYTFTGPDGKMVSSEERLRSLKEQGSNLVSTSDLITRVYSNAGMVTGIVTTKTPSGGTEQSRFIQLWVWQAGEWMLAAGSGDED